MKERDNIEIVKEFQKVFISGDFEALRKLVVEDVIWEVSGTEDYPFAGCYHGFERLVELFKLFGAVVADFEEYELEEYLPQGDKVIVFGREKIRWFGGNTFESRIIQVFTLHDKKITKFREARG
jgi:ketosteroid isomerase-like protein